MLPAMNGAGGIEKHGVVIAIDGPAGSGKSTLAAALAGRLRLPYVNTGLMYRALALRAIERGVDPDDADGLVRLSKELRFQLGEGPPAVLLIDGAEPDDQLVSLEVEEIVSRVSRHPPVREIMRRAQRGLGAEGCVMEGRDIGTVVFPDADVKLFLSAPPSVRADRRQRERGGGEAVAERDALDRRTNPLEPAPGAHVLDTSVLSREKMFEEAATIAERVLSEAATDERRI
jgi:cytidylate kinase